MRICVVVPAEDSLQQAGVRIRYRRVQPHLAALGHHMSIQVLGTGGGLDDETADVWLLSKCYDARAVLLIRSLRARGQRVGADFFDDMFSQSDDSRLTQYRGWLHDVGGLLDFALCSTEQMSGIVSQLIPRLSIHVLNDPFDRSEGDETGCSVAERRTGALRSRRITVAWFGVGDNPRFIVGLADLLAFVPDLSRFTALGYEVDLHILTNARALTPAGMEILGRLPVPCRIDQWSEKAEDALLSESLVAFLPVNLQGFSIAKSLNRAISALARGTQVLSSGYDLYRALGEFIYRDPACLVADLEADRLAVRPQTMPRLHESLHRLSDPAVEAMRLASFLDTIPPPPCGIDEALAVLHGTRSSALVHKMAQAMGHLSVATPFSAAEVAYDLSFVSTGATGCMDLRLSDRAVAILPKDIAARVAGSGDVRRTSTMLLVPPPEVRSRLAASHSRALGTTAMLYERVVNDVAGIVTDLFPGTLPLLSEGDWPIAVDPVLPPEAPPLQIFDANSTERILIIANGRGPSLSIFFEMPLQPLVAMGRVRTLVLTDVELRATLGGRWLTPARWIQLRERIEAFDPTAVVFCRYTGPLAGRFLSYVKERTIPSIYQIDDDLFHVSPLIGAEKYKHHTEPERVEAMRLLISATDLVYASTPPLARSIAETRLSNRIRTAGISAAAEIRRLPIGPRPAHTIGYMGGGDHTHDFGLVVGPLVQLLERHPQLRFELFSGIELPPELARFGDRVRKLNPTADYDTFLCVFDTVDWDIGLCPLAPTRFNASKAYLKWVEYTSIGVATVASAGPVYEECCSGGAGLLAQGPEEWVRAIDHLITDGQARYDQVQIAQDKLRRYYSPEIMHSQTRSVIESVLGRPLVASVTQLA